MSENKIKDMPTGIIMDLGDEPVLPKDLKRCFDRLYDELTKVGSAYYTPPKEELKDFTNLKCPKCYKWNNFPIPRISSRYIQCHNCLDESPYYDWRMYNEND